MTASSDRFRSPIAAVTEINDIAFAQVQNVSGTLETLLLDLYLPTAASAGSRPVIFWFHGGGFRPGNDRRQIYIQMFARAFAEKGFVGVAPDYRVRAERDQDSAGTLRDAVADGRTAVEWFLKRASDYQVDPQRVVLAGGSAGGMLVANLAHHPTAPLDQHTSGIKGVVSLWGPPWDKMRLFSKLNPHCPPTFLVHGTADELVPYSFSEQLYQELLQVGTRAVLFTLPGAPHTPLAHAEQIIERLTQFFRDECGLS